MAGHTVKTALAFLPPLLIVGAILTVSVFFNLSIIDIRYQELDRSLYKAAVQQDINKSLNMLAKFSIIKRRMERGSEDAADYAVESKVMAVISSDFLKETPRELKAWNYIHPFVRMAINVIRFMMGKKADDKTEDIQENKELEVAYFYERNRRYDKALEMYGSILTARKHSPDAEGYILLHKGFCESMTGEIDKARATFEGLIARFSDTEAGTVAWRLLDFINTVDDELEAARKERTVSLAFGKRLYLLMDYKNAISVFSELQKTAAAKDPKVASEALFLKGRCHEELGEAAMAVENYRRVLNDFSGTSFAQEANRRIYILGEFYERDKQITRLALDRLKKFRDENFFDELSTFSGILEDESKVSEAERLKQRESVRQAISQNDGDVLDVIEKLDLSGEKAAEQEIKRAEDRKIEALEQAKTRVIEKEKLDVNAHPLRKPSFIQREIKKRAGILQTIYNQQLKLGADYQGALKLVFFIEANGSVSHVEIDPESEIQDEDFRNRVRQNVETWVFPAIEDNFPAQKINYPIVFRKNE